ncbi:hypothetical protein Mal52_27680 [Symmachiella dynata]|uniref:Sialate O-acetylesterase domain-containing protein n=1 Tax=Symmachiella dynata TaxID=2527995 RepID=A0A517ZP82_9PLAN|nr:phosphate ABC transporter substrate-binding protein [Symmachiella dynata]QDU44289.1 hypothetical protein Mal52_27680 [Symmachiella dynata]
MRHIFRITGLLALLSSIGICDEPQQQKQTPTAVRSTLEQDIVGLWMMGQSLCEGAESLPIVTPTDSGWGNLMFQRGVRTWAVRQHCLEPEKRPGDQFRFVPLAATQSGGLGETIANGMADHLKSLLIATPPSGTEKPTQGPHFLVTYAGQGGRLIDELSSVDQSNDARTPKNRQHGGGYYKTSLDDARRARSQAEAMGKTFSIAALIWMQGEANGGPTGGINPSRWDQELKRPHGQKWYRDRLIDYRKQWSHDLQLITGQVREIPMFTYQTQGPAGEAQMLAADRDAHITMVGPHYMIPSAVNSRYADRYGDPIHMSADGERWYGEQVAKVMHRVLVEGEAWQPLRPRKAWIASDRTNVWVEFQVPRPPLVLDQTFLPREEYPLADGFHSLYGFQIRDSARAVLGIADVKVESPTRIRIQLAAPMKGDTDYTLSYGLPYAGQIGKITDIRKGPTVAGQATTELLIDGNIGQQLKPLLAAGAFYVSNMLSGDAYARAPIRHVNSKDGVTLLRFEDRELRNNTAFSVGQTLTTMRSFSYGNLRDSDPEKAIYRFADSEYGTRAGQAYPLWNWCVLFKQLPITDEIE